MSKIKLLTIAVFGLLIINAGMIAYLFLWQPMPMRPPHPGRHDPEGPKNIIIERLHFDGEQVGKYEDLIQDHRAAVRRLEGAIHAAKKTLYSSLADDRPVNQDSLAGNIAMLQKEIEMVHYHHFADIKRLCKPEQQGDFKELAKDLADFFNPRRKPQRRSYK